VTLVVVPRIVACIGVVARTMVVEMAIMLAVAMARTRIVEMVVELVA